MNRFPQVFAILLFFGIGSSASPPPDDGMTGLHWAVYNDQTAESLRLLKEGADAKAKNRYGVSVLALACINGNTELVEALVEAGAEVRGSHSGGESMLMLASRTGRLDPVKVLLGAGADLESTDRKGQTALMWAAAEGHAEVVRFLLEKGAERDRALKSGFSAFFFAVREGRREVVEMLLNAGVQVNAPMKVERKAGKGPPGGMGALRLAVENGHFDLAVDLLAAKADPNDQRSGFAPLHVLTWVRKPNRGDGDDGMPRPIGSGTMTSLEFAEALIAHGADVNLRLATGSTGGHRLGTKWATPFLMASKTADLPYMKRLVKHGADPLLSNADGSTPLMAAAGLGTHAPTEEAGTEAESIKAVTYILSLGGEVNTIDKNKETAMHGAAYKSLPDMVRWLADHGADISVWNQKNKRGWTPLLIAQGFRPGNFKPAPATIDALSEVMLEAGVRPPPAPMRPVVGKKKEWVP